MKEYQETHQTGVITLENIPDELILERGMVGDFGVQIAEDGRIWLCIDGLAFVRFTPTTFHTRKVDR